MNNSKFYKWILIVFIGLVACTKETTTTNNTNDITLKANGLDFSKYIAVGASLTAGYTDNSLFIAAQENSFPNILSKKFAMANGGDFKQPLMNDNIGGLLLRGKIILRPRLYLNGLTPSILNAKPTTEVSNLLEGNFNNFGIPGAKSFHFLATGYGAIQNLEMGLANPYFVRMNASKPTLLEEAVSKKPTFFTLIDAGGNDILGYALSGGAGTDQTGNTDLSKYNRSDITDPTVFEQSYTKITNALTKNGAKGVLATVPDITSLPHFTTIPYNSLNPSNETFKEQIPSLNQFFTLLNTSLQNINFRDRKVILDKEKPSPVVIYDENLTDISKKIKDDILLNKGNWEKFITQQGLTKESISVIADVIGKIYGKSRQATEKDLLVLSSATVIGTMDNNNISYLMKKGVSKQLAQQFSIQGITQPLSDKWVLTTKEQNKIIKAKNTYNSIIKNIANKKGLALVDLEKILIKAKNTGIPFDEFTLKTNLVFGGLFSLDGFHLTARGYALLANEVLQAIDNTYGSNFTKATNGLAKASEYPTNYPENIP